MVSSVKLSFLFSWKSNINENESLNYHTEHKNYHYIPPLMCKTNAHNIRGVSDYIDNPDWRVVIAKYVYTCKWNCWQRPECVNSSSFLGIRNVLRHIMAYFVFRSTRIHIKPSSRNNWSQLTIHNIVDTWNGCLKNRRWTANFRTKFSSAMKQISYSVGVLINKIVVFGALRIVK